MAKTIKNWLYIISPFILVSVGVIIIIIIDYPWAIHSKDGWNMNGIIFLALILLLIAGFDAAFKRWFKGRLLLLWVVELALLSVCYFWLKSHVG